MSPKSAVLDHTPSANRENLSAGAVFRPECGYPALIPETVVPRGGERSAVRVCLPGRVEASAFDICHSRLAWETCDDCLRAIARALAEEMDYSLEAALNRSLVSYWVELGNGNCSEERARDLALMTQYFCFNRIRNAGSEARQMFVGGLDAQIESMRPAVVEMPKRRRQVSRRLMAIAVLVGYVGLVAWLVWFLRRAS